MPIEVRELIIKAIVTEDANSASQRTPATNNAVPPAEEIINACVEKIVTILRDKMER